jgi:oligopeptide/dipeptide ABC transporter ATP-binding protein
MELGNPIVEVSKLRTHFFLDEGVLKALDGVSFTVGEREIMGLIGESGCGKSVTAQSILRIVPQPGRIVAGTIHLRMQNGGPIDLVKLPPFGDEIRNIRGRHISMIFQEPMTSLSPVHTIGHQIMEAIEIHVTPDKKEARGLTLEIMAKVGIPNPMQRIDEYPHQLSGGLRQRAMIAMALSCNPSLLIADEPTTALDVTVQAQILDLINHLQQQIGMSVLYITHDLGVISEIAENVAVMYLGRIVEYGRNKDLFANPLHPYTVRLLHSIPKFGPKAKSRLDAIKGNVPIPLDPPWQCGFVSRCPDAIQGTCELAVPALREMETGHFVRCFRHHQEREDENE